MNLNINDIINDISKGNFDPYLDRLIEAASLRRKRLVQASIVQFNAGDRIQFNSKVRPTYLQGALGTIKKIRQKKVVIDLDRPYGRFFKGVVVPMGLFDASNAPAAQPQSKVEEPETFTIEDLRAVDSMRG